VNRLKHGRTCVVKPHAMQKETCMRSRFNCVSAKLQLRLDTICAVKMPKRSARWTDEVTLELIEEFRNHPELWKVKSSAYFNKYKREEGWERLTKVKYLQKHSMFCTTISHFLLPFKVFNEACTIPLSTVLFLFQVCSKKIPDVTTDQVKMRVNTLRSNFRRELAKMKKTVSGESTEDVHEPSLWYYNQMMFIADQETPRPSISTISEDENDEEMDEENKNLVSTVFYLLVGMYTNQTRMDIASTVSSQYP